MDGFVENSFASVLVFYDQFKRTKLLSADLSKIAKKYGSKPDQLIQDLERKYEVPIPTKYESVNVMRICQVHSVPDSYLSLLPAQFRDNSALPYDPIYDIRSTSFDPERVLSSKRIISSTATNAVLDNLSKCAPLLSTYVMRPIRPEKSVKVPDPCKIPNNEKSVHIFESIGLNSSSKYSYLDDMGNETLRVSPFALAYTFMKGKRRVCVIIRKRAGVGGILKGFLKAFDKHFNLLLTDVDEEYSMLSETALKKKVNGGKSDLPETMKRHLPQLLVRGDNVVLMSSASSSASNYTYAKMKREINVARAATTFAAGPRGMSSGHINRQRESEEHSKGDAPSFLDTHDMKRSDINSTNNGSSSNSNSSNLSQPRIEPFSHITRTEISSITPNAVPYSDTISRGGPDTRAGGSSGIRTLDREPSVRIKVESRDWNDVSYADWGPDRNGVRGAERGRAEYDDQDVRYGLDHAIRSFRGISHSRNPKIDPRTAPRSELRSENRSDPRSELRSENRSDPRSELRSENRSDPRSELRSENRSDPRSELRSENRSDPRSELRSENRSDPRSELRSENRSDPRSELRSENRSDPRSELRSENRSDPRSELRSENRSDPRSELRSENRSDPRSELRSENRSDPRSELRSENRSDPRSELRSENRSDPRSELRSENRSDPRSELRSENRSDPRSELRSENRSDPRSELRSENRSDPRSELRSENRSDPRSELRSENRSDPRSELRSENRTDRLTCQPPADIPAQNLPHLRNQAVQRYPPIGDRERSVTADRVGRDPRPFDRVDSRSEFSSSHVRDDRWRSQSPKGEREKERDREKEGQRDRVREARDGERSGKVPRFDEVHQFERGHHLSHEDREIERDRERK